MFDKVLYAPLFLTLNVLCISESCIEIKMKLIFIFTLLCDTSKGFMQALNTFIKPFEAPQRSVKIKIQLNIFLFVRDLDGKS